jgi:hypothetical protein
MEDIGVVLEIGSEDRLLRNQGPWTIDQGLRAKDPRIKDLGTKDHVRISLQS